MLRGHGRPDMLLTSGLKKNICRAGMVAAGCAQYESSIRSIVHPTDFPI
jgi:hypothetical protein